MKKIALVLFVNVLMISSAMARDSIRDYSVNEALSLEQSKSALGQEVAFYFGDMAHGKVVKKFGEFKTNKKTNAFNKTDTAACQWTFLSAMLSLRDRALREGGNAVINIKSIYKGHLTSSNSTFQCGAGAFVSGVALVGAVVKIEK